MPHSWAVSDSGACWQRFDQSWHPKVGLVIALAAACSSHYLAVAGLACFFLAELAHCIMNNTMRSSAWAALFIPVLPVLVGIPMLLHYQSAFAAFFWSKPSWTSISITWSEIEGVSIQWALSFSAITTLVTASLLKRPLDRGSFEKTPILQTLQPSDS